MVVLNGCYVDVLRSCLDYFWTIYGRFFGLFVADFMG